LPLFLEGLPFDKFPPGPLAGFGEGYEEQTGTGKRWDGTGKIGDCGKKGMKE